MKKTFTTLLLATAAVCGANAETEALHFLDIVETTSGFDRFNYRYNDFNNVIQIQHIDYDDLRSSTFRSFTYDDKQQLIGEAIAQDYYETEFLDQYIPVSRIEYQWNDKNQMVRRVTWNIPDGDLNGEMTQYAIMDFTYDQEGRLSQVETAFANGRKVQRDDYTYDEDGRLVKKEVWNLLFGDPSLMNTIVYKYNVVDDIANITDYDYDPATGSLRPKRITDYIYNSDGDLEEIQQWNETRSMLVSKKAYTYLNDFSLSSTIYPANFEDTYWNPDFSEFDLVKKPIASRAEYAVNETTLKLELNDTYEYTYTEERKAPLVNPFDSVEMIADASRSTAFKSLRGGILALDGVEFGTFVRVIDMEGRTMTSGLYGNGIDVRDLPAGSYCVITVGGVVKFVK